MRPFRSFSSLLLLFCLSPFLTPAAEPLYKDPRAAAPDRARDLVARMTLEEKVSQLISNSVAIPRLDVPAYNWWNECLHGVARAGRATVFPETIGVAATWDAPLVGRMAAAIADEARAKHHEFVRRGKRNIYQGLTFWTPNINIFRDPRWGRGMETYGEDPYLTARLAVPFIRGLQGDNPAYFKTIATAKHYAVHSGPESSRHTFDARVDERDLRDTYLPQFEAAIKEGGAYSVMCAYNRVDGLPACASPRLLDEILRKQWGFKGYVVSDCGAIGDIYLRHKTQPTAEAGVASAVKAGCELDCGAEYKALVDSVKQGLIAESDVDQAVERLFVARFKLGMFDPPAMVPYAKIPYSVNDSRPNAQLALETARKSIVLLRNNNGILPLRKNLKTLAVIGPNADDVNLMLGNYNGDPSAPVTPLQAIRRKLSQTQVGYSRGCDLAPGVPVLEVIPASALFTSDGPDRKPGLKAEYFPDSNLDGPPSRSRDLTFATVGPSASGSTTEAKPLLTRIDPNVDFQWWEGAPAKGLDDDNFGVRWTGFLAPPTTGLYRIGGYGFNAYEIYIDGKRLVRYNNIHERTYEYEAIQLEAGKLYPIRVDFHHFLNDANMQLIWARPAREYEQEALSLAARSDAVVLFLGLSPRLEGEEMKVKVEGFDGGDRVSLDMPRTQEDLLKKIVELKKPTVLVLMNGSAVAINWARDNVDGIIDAWYPGQAGGDAIADVLFGDYNPAGRLPITFYKGANQLPPFSDYAMKGRTYRYFSGEPLFPFGFGLSYTTFAYSKLTLPAELPAGQDATVSVEVRNSGKLAGDEVVQLYLRHAGGNSNAPIRSLQGFQRITLKPGESRQVEFKLTAAQMSLLNAANRREVAPGSIEISVGGKQPGFTGAADAATTQSISKALTVTGPAKLLD